MNFALMTMIDGLPSARTLWKCYYTSDCKSGTSAGSKTAKTISGLHHNHGFFTKQLSFLSFCHNRFSCISLFITWTRVLNRLNTHTLSHTPSHSLPSSPSHMTSSFFRTSSFSEEISWKTKRGKTEYQKRKDPAAALKLKFRVRLLEKSQELAYPLPSENLKNIGYERA